jgi:hypothetical protein
MEQKDSQPIRIEADVSGFDAAMRSISQSTESFARLFASSMSAAVISGRDFDDTLRSIAMRASALALSQAFRPLEELAGRLVSGAVSGVSGDGGAGAGMRGSTINFNVQANDAASFRKSEGQIATMLARAVARGGRGM